MENLEKDEIVDLLLETQKSNYISSLDFLMGMIETCKFIAKQEKYDIRESWIMINYDNDDDVH